MKVELPQGTDVCNFLGNLKKITAAVLLLAGGFVSAQNKTITLEDYISLVEKNNKDLLLAEKNTESAWQTVNMARSALLPTVGVSAGYTRNMYELMQETVVGTYNTGSGSQIFPGYTQDVRRKLPRRSLKIRSGNSTTAQSPSLI